MVWLCPPAEAVRVPEAAPGALSGEQSVLGDGADAALHRPGDGSHVPHGSPGPVGTLGSELDLVSRLQGEGGEGVGAVLPGDSEAGEMVHYVDLAVPSTSRSGDQSSRVSVPASLPAV